MPPGYGAETVTYKTVIAMVAIATFIFTVTTIVSIGPQGTAMHR